MFSVLSRMPRCLSRKRKRNRYNYPVIKWGNTALLPGTRNRRGGAALAEGDRPRQQAPHATACRRWPGRIASVRGRPPPTSSSQACPVCKQEAKPVRKEEGTVDFHSVSTVITEKAAYRYRPYQSESAPGRAGRNTHMHMCVRTSCMYRDTRI